jgi:hypothetical protein
VAQLVSPQLGPGKSKTPSPWKITPDGRLVRTWQGDKERESRQSLAKALLGDLLTKAEGVAG